jgi:hypothetical protein
MKIVVVERNRLVRERGLPGGAMSLAGESGDLATSQSNEKWTAKYSEDARTPICTTLSDIFTMNLGGEIDETGLLSPDLGLVSSSATR